MVSIHVWHSRRQWFAVPNSTQTAATNIDTNSTQTAATNIDANSTQTAATNIDKNSTQTAATNIDSNNIRIIHLKTIGNPLYVAFIKFQLNSGQRST
jgi:hypothetical protein